MRHKWFFLVILGVACLQTVNAQIYIKTDYFGSSDFRNAEGEKIGGKGDLKVIQGGLQIPVSVKMNELNQPTAWAVALQGSYGEMGNKNLSEDFALNKLLNAQIAVIHTRPLTDKWSIMALVGGGVYTNMSHFSSKCFLGQGGVLFIRKMNPNLDLGGGAAINNMLGYPMAFFSLYLDWHKAGKYDFNLSMTTKFEISAGMKLNEKWKLRLIGEANGMSAVVDKDGESQIYVHNWGTIGFRPELKLGKMWKTYMTAGVSVKRESYYQKRTLKAFYSDIEDYPHFGVAPYISFGLGFGF